MRVGYVTYGLDRAPTGIGRYAVSLLHALAALAGAPELVLLTTERADRHGLWSRFERHALPGCRLLPALMTIGNWALSRAARRYSLDLVHDPNGIAPFFGPRAAARRIVTIHDAFAFVSPETHNRLDNWRYRWMLRRAANRADAILAVSTCSQRDLVRYLGLPADRIQVIPEGVDPKFRPVTDENERWRVFARHDIRPPYLLYVGGINARKNLARLLAAFAQVRQRHSGVMLVVGGQRQWQAGEVDSVVSRLGLADGVRFTGYLDDADLPALYSAAEAFVFPSLYEGFGLPPLEAMACGTPVITSNTSSLPEVVGDAALMVDPYDVEGLAAAMERALTDGAWRADLRRRGLEHASRYTWEFAAKEVLAVYKSVLQRTASPIRSYSLGQEPS